MSKHRAADDTLTLSPLARRIEELAQQTQDPPAADPRFVALHQHIAQVADVVRQTLDVMARQQERVDERYDAMLGQLERQAALADDVLATSNAARDALDNGAELLVEVRAMRAELQGSAGLLTGAQAVLEAGVRRMQTSGDALVRYLDDRDVALEAERDRVLRDVLEDFAASLHARERRSLARRLIDVVDRRRDARDAARWRREHVADAPASVAPPLRSTNGEQSRRVIDLDSVAKRRAAPRG